MNRGTKDNREEKRGSIDAKFVTHFRHPIEQLRSVLFIIIVTNHNGRRYGPRIYAVVRRDSLFLF